jgi:cell division protein FtsZ
MKGGGVTMMLYGESDQGPEEVVHESLNHPLLDIEIDGATGALIHVTGGPYMTLEQANQVCDLMTARLSPNANVIFGARQDPAFGDTIKVMSIITGVAHERLDREMMNADMLGDALNIARRTRERPGSGFQRFD